MTDRNRSYGSGRLTPMDRWFADMRYTRISKEILDNGALLDLGCGYQAPFLSFVKKRISRGYGVDIQISPNLKRQTGNLTFYEGKADARLPLSNASIATVTACALIEHVNNPHLLLSEAYRVLKPGGLLVLTTPSTFIKYPLEILAALGIINRDEIADHKRYYSKRTLCQALTQVGFKSDSMTIEGFGILGLNILALARK